MDITLLLLGSAILIVAAFFAAKRKSFVDKVNAIPGPHTNVFYGNFREVIKHNFEVLSMGAHLSGEFAGLFRVWIASFPYVCLNSPEYAESVLSSISHIDKSEDYSILHPWLRLGLLTSSGAKWHARRRLITPTFHFKILDEFLPIFNRNTDILLQKLSREADSGKYFDISHYVHLCALDTICESAMGTTVLAQENAESEYVRAVKVACCNAYSRIVKPWIYPILTFYSTSAGWEFSRALKVLHGLTQSVIKTRKRELDSSFDRVEQLEDGTKRRVAFLDQLLLANKNGAGLSDVDIQEEVDTFMFEGHDTTGTAISLALYELSRNPHVQDEVYHEVSSILGQSGKSVTMQDLGAMKYLERVIKEALRLYPSVPVFMRRLKKDLPVSGSVGDFVVPAGCTAMISPYLIHRLPSLWPEPDRFDPDRFLPENSVGRHAYAYIPFSAGPRNCIGQKYALMEMKCMLAKLVLQYRFLEAYPGYTVPLVGELILKARGVGPMLRVELRPGRD